MPMEIPEPPPGVLEDEAAPERIMQNTPSFFVRIRLDRADRRYRDGEMLRLNLLSEKAAFAYVLYKQADGQIFQIFPNSAQPDNRIRPGHEVLIPKNDDLFRWRVGPPFGQEIIKVVATVKPLVPLDDPCACRRVSIAWTPQR